jgi:hypothetical protein
VSSLTALFGNSENKPQDSEKLLSLYWNRAELKKEFASMRNEQFRMQDKIRQQEGATARLQQILDHLEDLLEDSQWASNVMVYYQLRGLAAHCNRKLARFAEQLKQKREKKQHSTVMYDWTISKTREARDAERRIHKQREKIQQQKDELKAERNKYMAMSGLMRFFKRRSVRATLNALTEKIEVSQNEEAALTLSLAGIKGRKAPECEGLDIPTKRSVNLMILSFAQQLYLDFNDVELATLAKEASEKSVGAINYGDHEVCDGMLQRIRVCLQVLEKASDFAGVLQERAKLISEKSDFVDLTDAVPEPDSVSTLYQIGTTGTVKESKADLLGQNFWGLTNVLSR